MFLIPSGCYAQNNLLPELCHSLTYYLDIIWGIVLKGIGFSYLVGQVISLLVFSVVFLALSVAKFKKSIA